MGCKYCGRVRTAIRKWLGIDEILTKQGENFTKYVNGKTNVLSSEIVNIHNDLGLIREAGAALESAINEFDKANAGLHKKNAVRLDALRDIISTARAKVTSAEGELESLSNRIHDLEFPGFDPKG